ncbi:expressed protein [Phakopsora pachyrhizi]|uniref:Expressed protein n=1 Tax=Phakopsora pachyrhizi TaxID=170000 RepID=A0AAV0BA08_PHAPC|nr:expressed protein [Phakopsora pachyrhizi]
MVQDGSARIEEDQDDGVIGRDPSTWLPPLKLNGQIEVHSMVESLDRLSSLILLIRQVSSYSIKESVRGSVKEQEEEQQEGRLELLDDWEKKFVVNWLTRLLSISVVRSCEENFLEPDEASFGDDGDAWATVSSIAARLLSQITGSNGEMIYFVLEVTKRTTASEEFVRKFKFQVDSRAAEPFSSTVEIKSNDRAMVIVSIREGTLSYPAIGSQTWNSAPLLCQEICSDPISFFPQLVCTPLEGTIKLNSTAQAQSVHLNHLFTLDTPPLTRAPSPSTVVLPRRSIKVLEIGSGTGLVGITAAIVVSRLIRSISSQVIIDLELILTDYHPEVLKNLKHNLDLNSESFELRSRPINDQSEFESRLTVRVESLDWRMIEESSISSLRGEVDVILGSDLVYEPEHATWCSNVVKYFLRRPASPSSDRSDQITSLNQLITKISLRPITPTDEKEDQGGRDESGKFHLLLPLRPTFVKESEAVYLNFDENVNLKTSEEEHEYNRKSLTGVDGIELPRHSSDWELDYQKRQDDETKRADGERSDGKDVVCEDGMNRLRISERVELRGVPFGQGCQDYVYLRIGWNQTNKLIKSSN